jgi:signal peptidase I
LIFGLTLTVATAAFALGGTAWADDWADCTNSTTEFNDAILGCSNIITAGHKNRATIAFAYQNRGIAYAHKGDLDHAIADETKAIELKPDYWAAYYERGSDYHAKNSRGGVDHAIADETKAIELKPQFAEAYWIRGIAYFDKADYDLAIVDETKAIELKPDDGNAYYSRGVVYAAKGDLAKALTDFRAAAQLIPASNTWSHNQALARAADLEKQLASAAPTPGPALPVTSGGLDAATPTDVPKPPPRPVTSGGVDLSKYSLESVRLALVIGNSAYAAIGELPNPSHDAEAIAEALTDDGFSVMRANDLTRAGFIAALNQFADAAAKMEFATIYFAGHGLQLDGVNYLVPVDAKLIADRDVQDEAIPLDRLINAVHRAKFGLVIVDACRNNPFLARMRFTGITREVRTRGLARVVPQETTLVEFSARDGQEALDGDPTGNSPFAAALAKRLATPGMEINKVLRLVRTDVLAATGNQQEPMFSGNFPAEDLYFRLPVDAPVAPVQGKGRVTPSAPEPEIVARFVAPSGSMRPTLFQGNSVIVVRYPQDAMPRLGDVVAFKWPGDQSTIYIKRVVGLPGDALQMLNGVLYINGAPVPRRSDGIFVTKDTFGAETRVQRYRETLPNGVTYDTLALDPNGSENNTPVYEVPPDHLFMMGDNRDDSTDSRNLSLVGYVPFGNVVGCVFSAVEIASGVRCSELATGGGASVAQKAVLYEEPINSTGDAKAGLTTLNATVTWRYIENGANGPAIEANLQVPERGMRIKMTIHKNADRSVPATHLIEIQIDVPVDFPGKGIRKVPRIVFKPTDETRGQPLVGADAKITDGFFWIALSASEEDISANLALLRERDWIDLPLVYETGQRAIFTFEKGPQGDQVFQKAMAAWQTPG